MRRIIAFSVILIGLSGGTVTAQEWARKMFEVTSHEFGTIARGANAEFAFKMTNRYKEDIHIAGVRASCGCATPRITRRTLKTWEEGAIVVKYNTLSFVGSRSATITVSIDRPYPAEVQLTINGRIRGDVVLEPGMVSFPSVAQGSTPERRLSIRYAGRGDWKIVDVRSGNSNLEVVMPKPRRSAGRVTYDLTVRLKKDMPAGYFTDQMFLVTNDPSGKTIPVRVEGNVVSALTVSPASLFIGVVKPGQVVTKQLVVRAAEPFRITEVRCADDCFRFRPSDEAKTLHLVPVTFTAGTDAGKVLEKIEIETDMDSGASACCVATATVKTETKTETEQEKTPENGS